MKVKLDENIPVRLAGDLAILGHDVDTVASEGLKGKPDGAVWSAARRDERFLITQDLDFSDIRQFKPGASAQFHPTGRASKIKPLQLRRGFFYLRHVAGS